MASGAAFTLGGALPLLVALFFPLGKMEFALYGSAIVFLVVLGIIASKTGGSKPFKSVARITIWGTLAMGLTALVGYFFGVSV